MVPPPGIINGQPVDETFSNAAWLAKNGDDTTIGKVTLGNVDAPNSGPSITNAQRDLNSISAFIGKVINSPGPTATPAWLNNDVGASSDSLFLRTDEITAKFNETTGHTHDGNPGEGGPIAGSSLTNFPLMGIFNQGTDYTTTAASSDDVSALMVGKVGSTGISNLGVVIDPPYNRVFLRQGSGPGEDDQIVDGLGNVVYGRLTKAALVWTLSYYVMLSGVETAYTFAAPEDVKWYYQELYAPNVSTPVYSTLAFIPSDNATQDVLIATTSIKGRVQLSTASTAVAATTSAGTANATVANADHTHQGVHSIKKFGDSELYGDVDLEGGTGITITRTGNKLTFDGASSLTPEQETPAEIPDGIEDTFTLSYIPYTEASCVVFVDGVQREKDVVWNLVGQTIVFTAGNIPQLGQEVQVFYWVNAAFVSASVTPRTEYRTVTALEATNKQLTLANTPSTSSETHLDVIGGGPQFYGDDFSVSGSTLSWNGLGLDGLLATGDKLRIAYFY
jgi:hypothetical protein